MADVTSKAIVKGIHQRVDRPFDWHIWEIQIANADFANGDTILLPDRWDFVPQVLQVWNQVIVASDAATSASVDIGLGKILKTTGAYTNIANGFAGSDLKTVATTFPGSGTTTWASYSTDFISNPTHLGNLYWAGVRLTLNKVGAATTTVRFLPFILMGRNDY